ncbi:MAG: acetylornithine deacetylase [Tranquillimonas sp.]
MAKTLTPREILDRLVAFPTVSRDSNLDLIDWVEEYLAGHGIAATRVPNADGTKAALYAQAGPDMPGGVILSGHTDVVPVDGQDWTSDPFAVAERGWRLYGRGTCDMKGFDALALAALPLALEAGVKRPIQIALSYDEEVGCTGAAPMVAEMATRLPRAAAAIIGEPSMMQAVTGHKGGISFSTRIRGYEVHSSLMHTGVSAIMEAARLIEWANARNAEGQAREPTPLAAMFEPPWTTVHVGRIAGGTAHNITAADCAFDMGFRCVAGEDPQDWARAYRAAAAEVEAGMRRIRPEARIEIEQAFAVPALTPEEGGAAETLVRALTGDNGRHVVSYGTEAGHFHAAGYSAVVCGPGDIAQAHQPDEYIEIAQFEAGWRFMQRLVGRLAA